MTDTLTPPTTRRSARLESRRAPAPETSGWVDASGLEGVLSSIPDTPKWAKKRNAKKVWRRRNLAIRAYIGPNGSFKSATAVKDLLPTLRGIPWHCEEPSHLHNDPILDDEGNATACGPNAVHDGYRLVFSTVEITLPNGDPHPLYRRLNDWKMVIDAEHVDLLFDEVTGIANARDSMGLPRQVQVILDQLRKRDTTLSFTAPSFQRADTTLRTTAVAVVVCRGYMPEPTAKDVAAVTAWRRMRLARVRTFDAMDFEEFHAQKARADAPKQHRIRPKFVQWWWGPGSEVFVSYSSKGAVARLGQANDSGACLDCGGARQRLKCTCRH